MNRLSWSLASAALFFAAPSVLHAETLLTSFEGEKAAARSGWSTPESLALLGGGHYVENTFQVPSSGNYILSVDAMAEEAGGAWPILEVLVDGRAVVSRSINSASFGLYQIPLSLQAGARTIRLHFTNDYWANPVDRNLFVSSFGLTSPTTGANLGWINAPYAALRDGGWVPATEGLFSNGDSVGQTVSFNVDGNYRFEINAFAQYAGAAWPLVELSIDDAVVGSVEVNSALVSSFSLNANVKAGSHRVRWTFTNDYWASPIDRNVFIDQVKIYTVSTSSPPPPPAPAPVTGLPPIVRASPLSGRVMVIYNSNSNYPQSKEVADYYLKARQIPSSNLCPISFSDPDKLESSDYTSRVVPAIRACLDRLGRQNILYIVSTFQTPYYLLNHAGQIGSSVDSNISDIWDTSSYGGWSYLNPYYQASYSAQNSYPAFETLASYRARAGTKTVYATFRLDARTASLAKGQVDKAIYAEVNGLRGVGCFDRRMGDISGVSDSNYGAGDWDIYRAAQFTRTAGYTVVEDQNDALFGSAPAPLRCDQAIFYAGWYSGGYQDVFTWQPGSIGFHTQSFSASWFRSGMGGSWAAGALERGITVSSGPLDEPYLTGVLHPDGVYRNLFQGATVGDAFLRNLEYIKWQVVNIGDPLYRPFPSKAPGF